ncbi:alpha/beta fold hydrolase [Duganella radicis]|uniref:Alpha/beta fold hydrolase n=1 Tax=Duganella radicis TaxID=551988 RepID=A0A6L6PFX8_9BURK|nr:alpha/beta hydrolase [Duganella radicis]MTV37185.1 alpha/beta fold hydrolase [Duganella radicis]
MPEQVFNLATPHGQLHARCWTPADATCAGRTPIILFHDSLGCVALWRDFPALLAEATSRKVIAYDRFGFGQSAPHPGGWSIHFIEDEARLYFPLLRNALNIGRFVAFGYSVGGGMAASCASLYADDCDALITMSAQAQVDRGIVDGLRQAQAAFAQPGQLERLAKYHGDKAAWVLHAWLDTWLSTGFADWRIGQSAPHVRCPLLALHGDRDEYGSLEHPRLIARLTSGPSQVVVLPDCHHSPQREYPALVLQAVRRFLAQVN